jgi:hypothetical protein
MWVQQESAKEGWMCRIDDNAMYQRERGGARGKRKREKGGREEEGRRKETGGEERKERGIEKKR